MNGFSNTKRKKRKKECKNWSGYVQTIQTGGEGEREAVFGKNKAEEEKAEEQKRTGMWCYFLGGAGAENMAAPTVARLSSYRLKV